MATITGENLNNWAEQVADLASKFTAGFETRFGYPPGVNELVRATPQAGRQAVQALAAHGVPGELLEFYAQVESLSLPDLDNGLYIHPASSVADGLADNQPTEVVGAVNGRIVVFGSDGGGGLAAMAIPGGRIFMLRDGALIGQRYETEESGVEIISDGLWGFLEGVLADLVQATSRN